MTRVATCRDCGARFKVPDSVTAQQSKCAKCGGVVEIPPVDGGSGGDAAPKAPAARPPAAPAPGKRPAVKAAPGRKPASAPVRAAARTAPSAVAPGAGKAPTTRKSSAGKPAAAARRTAKGAAGGRARKPTGGGRARGGARGRGKGGDGDSSSSALLWIVIVVVVLLAGGAAWWFLGGGGDDAATTPAGGTSATQDAGGGDDAGTPGGDDAGATPAEGAKAPAPVEDAKAPAPADGAAAPAANDGDTNAPDDDTAESTDAAPAPVAKAPAPAAAPPAGDDGDAIADKAPAPEAAPGGVSATDPLPTVLEFEPLPPVVGTTQEQLDEWIALLDSYYFDDSLGGIARRRMRDDIEALDGVNMIPAMFAVLDGEDIAEGTTIRNTFAMLDDWYDKVARKPNFGFNGDVTKRTILDNNKRVTVLGNIYNYWVAQRDKGQTEEAVQEYREIIENARLALEGG